MAETGKTRSAVNKSIRQEALREQLQAQGHVQHVVDISSKLADLNIELEQNEIQRLKAAADIKLKLIAKYAPDLKAVENTVEVVNKDVNELTIEELYAIAATGSEGDNKKKGSASKSNKIH